MQRSVRESPFECVKQPSILQRIEIKSLKVMNVPSEVSTHSVHFFVDNKIGSPEESSQQDRKRVCTLAGNNSWDSTISAPLFLERGCST